MKKMMRRGLTLVLTLVMVLSLLPNFTLPIDAAIVDPPTAVDPGTADAWEDIMGTAADGSRYAGRVWVDKSVYKDGDTVTLNSQGNADSTFTADVDQANGEYFQVVFSALGSSMSTNTTVIGSHPMDVVLILDNSVSMNTTASGRTTRMQYLIEAANDLLSDLLDGNDIRLGIVAYSQDASTVLPFGTYTDGVQLGVNSYTGTGSRNGVITAYNSAGQVIDRNYKSNGYANYTNTQAGIEMGMEMLANATNTANRKPVVIVMTDGAANTARDRMFVSGQNGTVRQVYHSSNIDPMIALSTLLGAAYNKAVVADHYGQSPMVYGIGVDLSSTDGSNAIIDPGANFNNNNSNSNIRSAYQTYTGTWLTGSNVNVSSGGYTFRFEHTYPQTGITDSDIAANINYVDNYQAVTGANLGTAFENIYEELITGAFNPITSTQQGATGVEETPLIYADNIGKYMQVKSVQALQVFGQTFNVTENGNGTYSIAAGSGTNPTTKESWSTDDVQINVIENADGTQQLRVYINQEILPILLDEITVTTEDGVTTATLEENEYPPLRLYYTLGIDESILLPNGQVDITKIDSDYAYVDSANGTVSFYANAFGNMNTDDLDGDSLVDLGDAHVGFIPSHNNRYYYHQNYQEVFISATNKDGSDIVWEDGEYGVLWDESKYQVKAMSYADYANMTDSAEVYTYISFVRPTGSGNAAEEVTYLVYTTWGDLKDTVTFHDKVNDVKINGGSAIEVGSVDSVVSAYKQGKNLADTDLIAVVGLQSRRVSRLHNMFEYKAQNNTESAELAYAPAYNKGAHEQGDIHEHSEVIVWLGNNGRLTLPIGTGLMVTKEVTEVAEGAAADEKFPISVLLDVTSATGLTFVDGEGNALNSSDYTVTDNGGKILVTFNLADGESAYILGLVGGVSYTVTEADHEKYTYTYEGATQTVAGAITEGVVTNNPIKPGNLYITKEVVHYTVGEPFPTDYEFEFEVTFVDKNGDPIANTEFELENNHDPSIGARSTDANGVMVGWLRHGETVYIKDIPAGATVTVKEVKIPDNYTATAYESIDFSGDTVDNDGVVTINPLKDATVVVKNTYRPKSTSAELDLVIEKTIRVDTPVPAGEGRYFDFRVERWSGSSWLRVESFDEVGLWNNQIKVGQDNVATAKSNGIDLGSFSKAGTYIYQIYEEIPDEADRIPGMTYDRTIYTITVTVTDVNGQLVATAVDQDGNPVTDTDDDGKLEFTAKFLNEENAAPVSIDFFKDVEDTSNNPEISKAGFEFKAVQTNENWEVLSGGMEMSVFTDGVGEARMSATYKEPGNYYYLVSEVAPDPVPDGWTYTDKQYKVQVVVTRDDTTGDLTANLIVDGADLQSNDADLTFTNTYDPTDAQMDLNLVPTVFKKLQGRGLVAGEFTFAIFENGKAQFDENGNLTNLSAAVATGTNDADGEVTFTPGKLTFSKLGKYEYDIVEVKGSLGGVTYDATIKDLVIEVTDDDQNGVLEINYYFEDSVSEQVTFENTYTVKGTEVVIDGIKTLQVLSGSKALHAGDYTFYLYNEAGEKIGEATNLENGTFKFDPIAYTGADVGKTYTYTVKEANAGTTAGGVTYSGQTFTVTVKPIDNGDGTMGAEVTGNGAENIEFVNKYQSKPVSLVLNGRKMLSSAGGRILESGEFKFALYESDMNFENRVLIDDTMTNDSGGYFKIDLGELDMRKHYFVLKEVIPETPAAGMHYDLREYHITIDVTDSGNGQMSYTKTVVNPDEPETTDYNYIKFYNTYRPADQQLVIDGTKTYLGGKALEDDVFQVGLYNADGELLQTAQVKADGTFAFEPLNFSYAEDYARARNYTVKEIIPQGATANGDGTYTYDGIIYDGSVFTVRVVTYDNDGVLQPVVTVNGTENTEIHFTNTHIPDSIEYILEATKTYEKGLKGNDFQFRLQSADDKTDVDQTKHNDAEGKIVFDPITFSAAGEYKFTVTEKKDGILSFIRPSQAEYEVTVTVVSENGVLRVSNVAVVNTKGTNESELNFINEYQIDGEGEITLQGTKILTGDRTTVEAGEFEFGLYDQAGQLVEKVAVDANGNFKFSTLHFDETDVPVNGQKQYTYTVKEIAGDDPYVTYDDTVYTVVVTVKDNDQGGVSVSYTVNGEAEGALAFTNTFTKPAPAVATVYIRKSVINKTQPGIGPEGFTFVLEQESGSTHEVTSSEEGKAGFQVSFGYDDIGKTYTFKVYEKRGSVAGVTYDTTVHTVIVKVETNPDGSIKTVINDVTTNAIELEFTNVYEKPQTPVTGDDFPIIMLLSLLVISGAAFVALMLTKKKKGGKYCA